MSSEELLLPSSRLLKCQSSVVCQDFTCHSVHKGPLMLFGVCWTTSSQRDILSQKLAEVDAQLRDAKADRKETERDRRMTDAVQKLKRMHPGMHNIPPLSQVNMSLLFDGCWDLLNRSQRWHYNFPCRKCMVALSGHRKKI